MKSVSRFVFLSAVILAPRIAFTQAGWGGKIGINLQIGTHIDRIGFMYQVYTYSFMTQVCQGGYFHFNFRNLGPKGVHAEAKFQFGLQFHTSELTEEKYLFNEFSNMAPYRYVAGYSFYVYKSGKSLSQTGALHVAIEDFLLAVDNDVLGFSQVDDKYRTGAFVMSYARDSFLYSIQNTLWTGFSKQGKKIEGTEYPARNGYRDVSSAKYGNLSHGILAARVEVAVPQDQIVRGEIGIDSEWIRHFFQNEFMHDGISGRFVKSSNAHYPMLQPDGTMYLFKDGQKVKRPRPYIQLGLNQPALY